MIKKEVSYELECPNCKTTFEVSERKVGKEPFDVECPNCGGMVGSERIVTVYEDSPSKMRGEEE